MNHEEEIRQLKKERDDAIRQFHELFVWCKGMSKECERNAKQYEDAFLAGDETAKLHFLSGEGSAAAFDAIQDYIANRMSDEAIPIPITSNDETAMLIAKFENKIDEAERKRFDAEYKHGCLWHDMNKLADDYDAEGESPYTDIADDLTKILEKYR